MDRKIRFLTKIMTIVLFCGVVAVSANSGDKFIDDYEKFINKYVEIIKKMQAGDMSVMPQVSELQAEVMQWGTRALVEGPNLTPEQAARLQKIGDKITKEFGGN